MYIGNDVAAYNRRISLVFFSTDIIIVYEYRHLSN